MGLYNGTEEAIPILGKYSSYDVNIIRKHEEWFEYLGIDWLLIDWTNFLIAKPAWEQQQGADARSRGDHGTPLQDLPPTAKGRQAPAQVGFHDAAVQERSERTVGIQRLNTVIQWATQHYLDNPEYKDLMAATSTASLFMTSSPGRCQRSHPGMSCEDLAKFTSQVSAPGWTVRWMGTQLEDSHVDQCGYWSWMDGTIRQAVTFRDGAPEETVVTPSCFPFAFTDALLASRQGLA